MGSYVNTLKAKLKIVIKNEIQTEREFTVSFRQSEKSLVKLVLKRQDANVNALKL